MRMDHSLRASDADRDAVVDRLRDAAGEGRLEPDELEQRVHRALRARTYGDLAGLLADLPGDGRVPMRPSNRLARPALLGAGLVVAVIVAVAVVAVVLMVVLVAAAAWIALVLFRLVCCGSRRGLVWGPAGHRAISARHAHRTRPTG